MMRQIFSLGGVLFFLIFSMSSLAGQGVIHTCSDFLKLSAAEQRRYLEGYTLGAAMELGYFKNNILGHGDFHSMETRSPVRKALKEPPDNPDPHNPSRQLDLFRSVTFVSVQYVDEKDTLVNIAAAYPKEFHKTVQKECKTRPDVGTFDELPSTLRKMKETGKYPVRGL